MRHFISITILLFWTNLSFGQIELVSRKDNETVEQFAERQKPENSTLTHTVLKTKWNKVPVIISLYDFPYKLPVQDDPDQQTYHRIGGFVFSQLDKNTYSKITFGSIDTEGGDPTIETVFFANADNDKAKELIIIAFWKQRHYDVNGTLYGTYVFDNETIEKTLDLKFLEEISKKLVGGCECTWGDGTNKKAKLKTALEVKQELIRLGIR
ncbi:hypothetical protein [Flavobacterium sp.]|uniref:hypothetical protein n=1 Tax=Flavobacterium sp. TaxID=239 RepID=UPI00263955DE|nr:hypothetical protein [Flavobacterium sp.]